MTDAGQPDLDDYAALTTEQLRVDALVVGPERRRELMSAFGEILSHGDRGAREAMDAFREVTATGTDLPVLLRNAEGSPTAESAFFSALHDLAEAGSVEVDVGEVARLAGSLHPNVAASLEGYQRSLAAADHEQPFTGSVSTHQHIADLMALIGSGVQLGELGRSPEVRAMVDQAALRQEGDLKQLWSDVYDGLLAHNPNRPGTRTHEAFNALTDATRRLSGSSLWPREIIPPDLVVDNLAEGRPSSARAWEKTQADFLSTAANHPPARDAVLEWLTPEAFSPGLAPTWAEMEATAEDPYADRYEQENPPGPRDAVPAPETARQLALAGSQRAFGTALTELGELVRARHELPFGDVADRQRHLVETFEYASHVTERLLVSHQARSAVAKLTELAERRDEAVRTTSARSDAGRALTGPTSTRPERAAPAKTDQGRVATPARATDRSGAAVGDPNQPRR